MYAGDFFEQYGGTVLKLLCMRKLVNSTPEKFPLVDHSLVIPVGFTPLGLYHHKEIEKEETSRR